MTAKNVSPAPRAGGDGARMKVQARNQNQQLKYTEACLLHQSRQGLSAREVTAALGGQWHGHYGAARCPAHDDRHPSLGIGDHDDGGLWWRCHAGCEWGAVRAALAGLGLVHHRVGEPGAIRRPATVHPPLSLNCKGAEAQRIWTSCGPAGGTLVESYLQGRGILVPPPPCIRFHRALRLDGGEFPTMVAAVERVGSPGIVAIHRTFLDPSQAPPMRLAKKMLGPVRGGAVRLAPAAAHIGLAEGIETGLSVMTAVDLAVWACLSTTGLEAVMLPPLPLGSTVTIFADNDASGAGMSAALTAKDRLVAEGRTVRIALPPIVGSDFNDVLRG